MQRKIVSMAVMNCIVGQQRVNQMNSNVQVEDVFFNHGNVMVRQTVLMAMTKLNVRTPLVTRRISLSVLMEDVYGTRGDVTVIMIVVITLMK